MQLCICKEILQASKSSLLALSDLFWLYTVASKELFGSREAGLCTSDNGGVGGMLATFTVVLFGFLLDVLSFWEFALFVAA